MGWEPRENSKGGGYYYRSHRRGNKVTKTYIGPRSDPNSVIVARLDQLNRATENANREAELSEESTVAEKDLATYFQFVKTLEKSLQKQRIKHMKTSHANDERIPVFSASKNSAPSLPSRGEYLALAARADKGNVLAQEELCRLFDKCPELWRTIGDLSELVEGHLLSSLSQKSFQLKEAFRRQLCETRSQIKRTPNDRLEQMLTDRVLISWLEVQIRQIKLMEAQSEATIRACQSRLNQAQARNAAAIESLKRYQATSAGPCAEQSNVEG